MKRSPDNSGGQNRKGKRQMKKATALRRLSDLLEALNWSFLSTAIYYGHLESEFILDQNGELIPDPDKPGDFLVYKNPIKKYNELVTADRKNLHGELCELFRFTGRTAFKRKDGIRATFDPGTSHIVFFSSRQNTL